MGAGLNKVCVTCRKDYYLGYSSYRHHDELAKKFPWPEHEGHEILSYTEDFTYLEGDDLMLQGQYENELYIKDCGKFEQIDLDEPTPSPEPK